MLAGLVVFAVFGRHQRWRSRHGRSPLIEASLFSNHGFPAALASAVLFFAVVNGLMLVIVLQLQLGLHADVLTAGLTLVPWSGGLALSSWLAGAYLVPRFGPRVMFAGLAVLFAGIVVTIGVYGTSDAAALSWPFLAALADSGAGPRVVHRPVLQHCPGTREPAGDRLRGRLAQRGPATRRHARHRAARRRLSAYLPGCDARAGHPSGDRCSRRPEWVLVGRRSRCRHQHGLGLHDRFAASREAKEPG
jgi:hypothetical protein